MDHLNHARNCAQEAEISLRENSETLYFGTLHDLAALHARIAQAEALARIAEVAETMLEIHMGADDRTAHIADLTEQLVQAQSEYAWTDKENDRLMAENKRLREQLNAGDDETPATTPEDVDRQMGMVGTVLDAMRRHGIA